MRFVAKVVAASCCAVLAAQAEPTWLAHLASDAHREQARTWLQALIDELVGRQPVRGFDEVRDAAGKPLFAPVAGRRFEVTGDIPVVEFLLTVAPAPGR